ncbi:MAG: GNAT family protein [Deinococcota bacterium]
MISDPLVLEGEVVKLIPLTREHIPALLEISFAYPDYFQYTSTPTHERYVEPYFNKAFSTKDKGSAYPFVIIYKPSGQIVGTTRYADILWDYRNLELGYSWLHPDMQGTAVNIESKYVMLKHVFEVMNFVRVQIHTDARNVQSQEAIKRLGAVYEGTLRRHMIQKNNYVRDTVVFAITDIDWQTGAKEIIEARLAHKHAQVAANSSE